LRGSWIWRPRATPDEKKAGEIRRLFRVLNRAPSYRLRLVFLREPPLRAAFRVLLRPVLLRLDFLPPALLRAPPFLRPPLFAAAMLSLHDEVGLSPAPWLKSAGAASRHDRPRVTKELIATTSSHQRE
jgi:hypothetical protein